MVSEFLSPFSHHFPIIFPSFSPHSDHLPWGFRWAPARITRRQGLRARPGGHEEAVDVRGEGLSGLARLDEWKR